MAKNLVIVESPAKVKTIQKFLGKNYEILASGGHVRDLPKSQLGFSPENDYEPKYITIRGKGDVLAKLRKEVKKADVVYLATDPDREGEAISWHLSEALKLEDKKTYRISFNEITKQAVTESIKHPREINQDLVNAQQARRMLDRMLGYRISPLLWSKIKRGLSAGRVQSVALRMIADREAEIEKFIPEEYWTIEAQFAIKDEKKPLTTQFYGKGDTKLTLRSKEEVEQVTKDLAKAPVKLSEVKNSERKRKAPLPFTTSTLQQEASRQLNFSTQKTMRLAQELYEGVEIKGKGTIGLITYLRTDSVRVADSAVAMARDYITAEFGEAYVGVPLKTGGEEKAVAIQDAHEAIRPTDITLTPQDVKGDLGRELFRLYQLIWRRFTASQMATALFDTKSVKVDVGEWRFTAAASVQKFDGFLKVYSDDEEKAEKSPALLSLSKDSELSLSGTKEDQHFTQPPAHFTEASLVKALEEQGIGRPSTYAPTITTILARHYVVKENKNLYITELGDAVNQVMVQSFPSIVNLSFTANLESLLDMVGEGKVDWKTVISNFYPDLDEAVKNAEASLEKVTIADEETDVVCENCGRHMVVKFGPHGKFLACPGFPDCKNTKPFLEEIGVACPLCGKAIVLKKTRKGRRYYGCEANPECAYMTWNRPKDTEHAKKLWEQQEKVTV